MPNGYFDCFVDGVDSRRIMSIEIPKMSIETYKKLKVKLEIYPFEIEKTFLGDTYEADVKEDQRKKINDV